jgi:GrpB-like predicted nucleotidyltransferase (UPF0157 family)
MPSRAEIVSFDDSSPPVGADPWVPGTAPAVGIEVTGPDPDWPLQYGVLAGRIHEALGWRVLQLEHVGSTAVPGLPAKPIIDIDLAVADPGRERDYIPALEATAFRLTVHERHRIFRDWLRGNPADRDRYAAAKRRAASEANAGGEHVMQYNARKEQVIREIYHRAFVAAGLLQE